MVSPAAGDICPRPRICDSVASSMMGDDVWARPPPKRGVAAAGGVARPRRPNWGGAVCIDLIPVVRGHLKPRRGFEFVDRGSKPRASGLSSLFVSAKTDYPGRRERAGAES